MRLNSTKLCMSGVCIRNDVNWQNLSDGNDHLIDFRIRNIEINKEKSNLIYQGSANTLIESVVEFNVIIFLMKERLISNGLSSGLTEDTNSHNWSNSLQLMRFCLFSLNLLAHPKMCHRQKSDETQLDSQKD